MVLDRRAFLQLIGATTGAAALSGCTGFGGGGGDSGGTGSDDEITFTLWAGDVELAAFEALPPAEPGDWVAFRTLPPLHGFLVSGL